MGFKHFLLALLLLSLSLSADEVSVNSFVNSCLSENETFTKEAFEFNGSAHYIVSIEGGGRMIVADGASPRALTRNAEINSALAAYYGSRNISRAQLLPSEEELAGLEADVGAFNRSRGRELECKSYIGIDRFDCYDQESCWRACYTPVCQTMKVGSGKPFLDLILSFNRNSSAINANLSAFNRSIGWMRDGLEDLKPVDRALAAVRGMRNASNAISSNSLFDRNALGFCKPPQYNSSALIDAEVRLVRMRGRLLPLFSQGEEAAEISDGTALRLERMERGLLLSECNSFETNSSQVLELVRADLREPLGFVSYPELKGEMAELESLSSLNCSGVSRSRLTEAMASFESRSELVRAKAEGVRAVYTETGAYLAISRIIYTSLSRTLPDDPRISGLEGRLADLSARLGSRPSMEELRKIGTEAYSLQGMLSSIELEEMQKEEEGQRMREIVIVVLLGLGILAAGWRFRRRRRRISRWA